MNHVARTMIPAWGVIGKFVTSSPPAKAMDSLSIPIQQAAEKMEGGPIPGGWNLWSHGRVGQYIKVARTGRNTIVVRAWGSPAGRVWPETAVLVDALEVKSVTVASDQPADYAAFVELNAGVHEIAATFCNDAQVGNEDCNRYLYLERITVDPPTVTPAPSIVSAQEQAMDANRREREIVVCFAHPTIRAITWWDLSDQDSWLERGGMLRSDMTPKPVYEKLRRLIHEEWTTSLGGTITFSGRFAFRGFRGTYQIKATARGRQKTQNFALVKADDQELRIRLP